MSYFTLIGLIVALGVVGFFIGRQKVRASKLRLHSLPRYYGTFVAINVIVPAIFALATWLVIAPFFVKNPIAAQITDTMIPEGGAADLVMSDIERIATGMAIAVQNGTLDLNAIDANTDLDKLFDTLAAAGVVMGGAINPDVVSLAAHYTRASQTSHSLMIVAVLLVAVGGFIFAYRRLKPDFRARNNVEQAYLRILMMAAGVAILTTVGIVASMLFETINFLGLHSWRDFFFGLNWAPNFHGDSELAILPLLWGTLYISLVALLVAVPIGLFAAIYLSEYAPKSVRGIAKPLLEVLAGIPTIVYGLFALVVFGPFLRDLFGDGGAFGVEWMGDARSVATAGIMMGVMLIPFVSSLSDDIINAVPQSLRDGSFGLGATQSETVKQVILPAALPGIVGAILLAASRAIGETMIVVLGAGAIARFTANPLEALTTITTRIVAQLTGDGDFNSPETLVAFALGLTLFFITLGLNVIALTIVRKYREQYE